MCTHARAAACVNALVLIIRIVLTWRVCTGRLAVPCSCSCYKLQHIDSYNTWEKHVHSCARDRARAHGAERLHQCNMATWVLVVITLGRALACSTEAGLRLWCPPARCRPRGVGCRRQRRARALRVRLQRGPLKSTGGAGHAHNHMHARMEIDRL